MERVLAVLGQAAMVEPEEVVSVCRDPKDDKFFACALAARAGYLVSEDRDILDVAEYRGIRTVSATQFLSILYEGDTRNR
jgi:predicted nucleic acid-binding protein